MLVTISLEVKILESINNEKSNRVKKFPGKFFRPF